MILAFDPVWVGAVTAPIAAAAAVIGLVLQLYFRRPRIVIDFVGGYSASERYIAFGVRALNVGGKTARNVVVTGYVHGDEVVSDFIPAIPPDDEHNFRLEVARPAYVELEAGHTLALKGTLTAEAVHEGARRRARATHP